MFITTLTIVVGHGFQKKSQKTPAGELELAQKLMKEYFDQKNKDNEKQKENLKSAKSLDELLYLKYGKVGTPKRDEYEQKANYFVISQMLKEARKEAKSTQEELAARIGTQKSYISRLENGKCDIQLSTLFKIFETGLGKQLRLTIL